MENINYNLLINGNDFKEIKEFGGLMLGTLKKEGFDTSISIKPSSNISNFSGSLSLIKIGKFYSTSCSKDINAIISFDYQSILNLVKYINGNSLIFSDYSSFNACNYFLAENEMIYSKIKEKSANIFHVPVDKIVDLESMGKSRISPYISMMGAFIAKSEIIDIGTACDYLATISSNDEEKENYVKTILAGYDFINENY